MTRLNLFACDGLYFETKAEAKHHRNGDPARRVSLGPDHWRFGLKGNPRTHSHNNKSGGAGTGFPHKKRH